MSRAPSRTPRLPTQAEQLALFEVLLAQCGEAPAQEDRDHCAGLVDDSWIAVFDNYISDSPGYAGAVMIVVYPAGPECVEAYTWALTGEMIRCKLDVAV